METHVAPEQELIKRARDEIEKRTGKTPQQLYQEREKRITDVFALKETDRVPVIIRPGYFPLLYAGLPRSVPFYEPAVHKQAIIRTLLDFDADVVHETFETYGSGLAMEKLGTQYLLWPGGPLPPDGHVQTIEGDLMRANEYDLFMTDPTDFMIRRYLPRRFKALEDSFSELPPLGQNLYGSVPGLVRMSPLFATPAFLKAAEALLQAGRAQQQFSQQQQGKAITEIVGMPQLTYPGGIASMPFDVFASYLRGIQGTMIDMFKQPVKLLAAAEKVVDWRLARATPAKTAGQRTNASNNHYASEAFMSKKQFETFCWPTWKRAIKATVDLGYTTYTLLQGKCDAFVDLFLELPKGKSCIGFETIDIFRAKEILGGHLCIAGGVPGSLLWTGSPQEVEEHCKKIIQVCGKGGGFMLNAGVTLDDAKPANVKAMLDSVKKYGRYD